MHVQVLSWIDVCAGLSAKTLAQGPCVTASVDAVHFLRPCRWGLWRVCSLASRVGQLRMWRCGYREGLLVDMDRHRVLGAGGCAQGAGCRVLMQAA